MPIARVQMPDGRIARVEVPAGTSPQQAEAMAHQAVEEHQAKRPTSFWQGMAEGFQAPARNIGKFADAINPVTWAADALVKAIGHPEMTSGAQRQSLDRKFQRAASRSPNQGSTLGKIAGNVAGTAPTMMLPGGPLVQGAASGALSSEDTSAGGLTRGALIGGMAGHLGGKVGGMIGGKVLPKNVRKLVDEGVTLTPGQLAGPRSARQFMEDKVLGSLPGLNAIPDAAAQRANNSLRVAVGNRVLKPIGETVPKGTQVNHAAIGQLQDKVYGNLEHAAGNLNLQLDPELAMGMSKIVQDAPRLVGQDGANQLQANIAHIAQMTHQQPITGQPLRDTLGELRKTASGAQGELRTQLWNLHDEVANALERQNAPEASAAFTNAREAAALMKRMETAASKATDGEFGPTQLLQAARQRGFGTSTGNVASGEARLMDLANAAADVMRNKTANSGTVPRALAVKAAAGELGMGGALGAIGMAHPVPAAAIGASMLGYIPGVAEILQRFAVNRPQVLQQLGRGVETAAPLGAGLGIAGLLPGQ